MTPPGAPRPRASSLLRRVAWLTVFIAPPLLAAESPATTPPPSAPATAVTPHDLGSGLVYFRAHQLPADLPPAATPPGALVLDLRFATAQVSGAETLGAWLKFRASPKSPVLILLNSATDSSLLALFAEKRTFPGVVTLGPTGEHCAPDIAIDATAEEDEAAYHALEQGTAITTLLSENPDKTRSDEAALVQERAHTPVEPVATEGEDSYASLATPAPAPPPPDPVIDRTLLRALHVHRALVALKRLN